MKNLYQSIMTKNLAYTENRWIVPQGVFLHSTGAGNPMLKRYVQPDDGRLGYNRYQNHWNRPYCDLKRKIAPQFCVGQLENKSLAAYQLLPFRDGKAMRGHHSGVGKNGCGNDYYIGIEICEPYNLDDKEYALEILAVTEELVAHICETFKLDPLGKTAKGWPVILDHAYAATLGIASFHGDIMHWYKRHDVTLDGIRKGVAKLMAIPEPLPPDDGVRYRVQVGSFRNLAYAVDMSQELTDLGYSPYITKTTIDIPTPEPPKPKPQTVKVMTKNGLNVRALPSSTAKKIKTLAFGSNVIIETTQEDRKGLLWGYAPEHKGWIALVPFTDYK